MCVCVAGGGGVATGCVCLCVCVCMCVCLFVPKMRTCMCCTYTTMGVHMFSVYVDKTTECGVVFANLILPLYSSQMC